MDKKFGTDLTIGSIPRHLLVFSIPMLLGNLIQIGYSIINTIWVGHLVGEDAVGAVGISFPILFILIGFAMGITMATTILVSQYLWGKRLWYGRKGSKQFIFNIAYHWNCFDHYRHPFARLSFKIYENAP